MLNQKMLYTHDEVELLIKIRTTVKLLKKDKEGNKNDLPPILKYQIQRVLLNKNYSDMINEVREMEGVKADFKSEGRKWGTTDGAIVTHEDGTEYLSYILLGSVGKPTYKFDDGSDVDFSVFEKFMPAKKVVDKGPDDLVSPRTVKVSNIVEVCPA